MKEGSLAIRDPCHARLLLTAVPLETVRVSGVQGVKGRAVIHLAETTKNLVVSVAPECRLIVFKKGERPMNLSIDLFETDNAVQLKCQYSFANLVVSRGDAHLDFGSPSGEVLFKDCQVKVNSWSLTNDLVLDGPITITGRLSAERTRVARETLEMTASSVALGDVLPNAPQSAKSLRIELGRGEYTARIPHDCAIVMAHSQVSITAIENPLSHSTFLGVGRLETTCSLESPLFAGNDGGLKWVLPAGHRAIRASGNVSFQGSPGSVVIGDRQKPLSIEHIDEVPQADLMNVRIDRLPLDDLQALEEARQLSPAFPRWAYQLRTLVTDMPLSEEEKVYFWARIVIILGNSHASGVSQANARYCAAVVRKRAARGRERILLTLFGLVGYGERISSPLVWYGTICTLATFISFGGFGWGLRPFGQIADRFFAFLLSPLRFFRVSDLPATPDPKTLWGILGGASVSVLGVVLILFSLIAVRRVTKAE